MRDNLIDLMSDISRRLIELEDASRTDEEANKEWNTLRELQGAVLRAIKELK